MANAFFESLHHVMKLQFASCLMDEILKLSPNEIVTKKVHVEHPIQHTRPSC